MKKILKISSLMFIVVLLVPGLVLPASMATLDEYEQKKQEREELANQNSELTSQLESMNSQVSDMYEALQNNIEISNSIALKEQSYAELLESCMERYNAEQELLNVTTELMNSINNEIAELEEKQKELEASLTDTVRNLHENGSAGYMEFLLGSSTVVDFLNRFEYVTSIMEYHKRLLDDIELNTSLLEDRYAEFESLRKTQQETIFLLESRRAAYDEIISECMTELETLNSESQAMKDFIAIKEADMEKVENQIADVIEKLGDVDEYINKFEDESFFWPCKISSYITSEYGYRTLEGKLNLHKGIDINSRYYDVFAARLGVVVTAEYSSSYGYYIIIAHSDGVQTWYAHLSKMHVKPGDVVSARDLIGVSGNTGWSTGPHLHFEIRVDGSPVNPLYCKSLGITGKSSYYLVP